MKMQTNTVVLSLTDYNALREFKENVDAGKHVVIESWWNYNYHNRHQFRTTFNTVDESVANIAAEYEKMKNDYKALELKLANIDKPKDITINDIKNMSI